MRLLERTRLRAEIAPRICAPGALGGRAERFSETRAQVWVSALPEAGELARGDRGVAAGERLRLLAPGDVRVAPGDGVFLGEKAYRVASVQRWTAHLELVCEAIS